MRILDLDCCSFSTELCMSLPFSSMDQLRNLHIRSSHIEDSAAFIRCLRSTHHLQLHEFHLTNTPLNEAVMTSLADAIAKWGSLNTLVLRNLFPSLDDVSEASSAVHEVFDVRHQQTIKRIITAIAQCTSLQHLHLTQMHIADETVPVLCVLMNGLHQLKTVYLRDNELSSNGVNALSECLALRPQKMEMIDIRWNKEAPSDDTIRRLKMRSNYVVHN